MHPSPLEIGLIVFLVLLVFGAGRIPQIFGGFGKAINEFRKAKSGEEDATVKPEK